MLTITTCTDVFVSCDECTNHELMKSLELHDYDDDEISEECLCTACRWMRDCEEEDDEERRTSNK